MSARHATELPKPYCAACGHDLTGATAANACPECGRPLVEVLTRAAPGANGRMGMRPTRRYTSERRIFGMPLVAIAYGPDDTGRMGHAKGYFAFGDIATGVFAIGGFARGLVAVGGMSVGGVTFGGLSVGTFASFGGMSVAWLGSAVGGFAVGLMANGGGAIGAIAQGGLAVGWLARGAQAIGVHTWSARGAPNDAARALFDQFAWLIGPAGAQPAIHYGLAYTALIALVVTISAAVPVILARERPDHIDEELRRTP
jgi:predicted RNA-binding Zn-ribbon protein involved in translation (DUF1610 family)